MDRLIRDKDAQINKLKDLIRNLEKEKNADEARIDDFILQIKQNCSNANDQLRGKDEVIQTLNDNIVKLKLDIDSFSKNTVNADVRYSDLSQENEKLKKSISMYKTKLNEAAKREKFIEADKVQLDMEWRKNFDSLKNLQFMNSEELVQNLTETNEKVRLELNSGPDAIY
jgi:chromosome segregation ATPase